MSSQHPEQSLEKEICPYLEICDNQQADEECVFNYDSCRKYIRFKEVQFRGEINT